MDAVHPALIDQIEHVLSHSEEVRRVDSVKVRWIGHELHAEIEIAVDPASNIADAHAGVGAADGSVALA
jgi:divalent metal cation (Fe/Co/Zn/Cd) transporter